MDLVVPDHIAYCFSAGRPIFLDIARDRYFTVSGKLADAFGAYLDGDRAKGRRDDIEALVRHGLLAPSREPPITRRSPPPARREIPAWASRRFALSKVAAVASVVWSARRDLRRQPFAKVIEQLRDQAETVHAGDVEQTLRSCGDFLRHRSLVPIASVCLLDSLALLHFLRARDGRADLVFGVTASPFSAHCWVQLGDQVLNDHLDRVLAFTPILVV
jgi:hypothetical protein